VAFTQMQKTNHFYAQRKATGVSAWFKLQELNRLLKNKDL
jgi:hypothetical protein